ncbi:hypothetical protein I2W78_14600 [Streptomyces spinoverrucosus]|uniref:hypothetical protein n=1 Tax=Streptomyces spinoverrucosus TaxID=284043 RepID=UPI0018C3D5BA|nr:hypothetical protein [Streptomyces spinoverrucosus]MBG0853046.1 hypothetical protein [Streptomyces spinoverrucosus]
MKRILASLGATAVLAAGAVALTPASASAAAGCWGNAGQKQGPGGATYTARYCHNYQGSEVGIGDTATGYLYAGDNWFVCQQQFTDVENPPVGDARNNWWLWTQGDDAYSNNGWGWFPATKVSGGGNYQPIPGLQNC